MSRVHRRSGAGPCSGHEVKVCHGSLPCRPLWGHRARRCSSLWPQVGQGKVEDRARVRVSDPHGVAAQKEPWPHAPDRRAVENMAKSRAPRQAHRRWGAENASSSRTQGGPLRSGGPWGAGRGGPVPLHGQCVLRRGLRSRAYAGGENAAHRDARGSRRQASKAAGFHGGNDGAGAWLAARPAEASTAGVRRCNELGFGV